MIRSVLRWITRLLKLRRGVPAIGFLVAEVSGSRREWHEGQIRSVGARLGYTVMKTMVTTRHSDIDPISQLITMVQATGAEAVIVPDLTHFDDLDADVKWLVLVADVVPVDEPGQALSRRLAFPVDIERR